MRVLRIAFAAACVAALLGHPATAGGCPCPKGQAKTQGVASQVPTGLPLPPPLPPEKTTLAAASG
jgi:hypothetical protein